MADKKTDGLLRRTVLKLREGKTSEEVDVLAREEPLELRVEGETLMVTMRTPGADRELALGFLYAEGVISGAADLGQLVHCGRPGDEGFGNILDALPAPGFAINADAVGLARRGTLTTAACGVCGRQSIDDLHERLSTQPVRSTMRREALTRGMEQLRARQPLFELTGGIHGAALLLENGDLSLVAEDVGRHNAVDKVIGMALFEEPDASLRPWKALIVSGRLSYEIVQKAAAFQVPVVAAVSAPSSLAVEVAESFGISLCGFVRGDRMNIYTHAERLSV